MQVSDKKEAGSLYLLWWEPEYKISPRESLARAPHTPSKPRAVLSSPQDRLDPTSSWFCYLVTPFWTCVAGFLVAGEGLQGWLL